MISKKTVWIQWLLFAGIIVLLNVIGQQFFFRVDFTEDQRYTLSSTTKQQLKELPRPVTVRAFFSDNLPPRFMQVRQDFRDLLSEYHEQSNGQVVYTFENPSVNEQTEIFARSRGIEPRLLDVRERDEITQRLIYMGAIIEAGEHSVAIPFLSADASVEFEITRSIKRVIEGERPTVGILSFGSSETKGDMEEVADALENFYRVVTVNTLDSREWLRHDALIFVQPKDTLSQELLRELDLYIEGGGNLLLSYAPLRPDMRELIVYENHTGIRDWLEQFGIMTEPALLIDTHCGSVTIPRQMQGQTFNFKITFPYYPVINRFNDHPITNGLASVFMPWSNRVLIDENRLNENITSEYLAFTSGRSDIRKPPVEINLNHEWEPADFTTGDLPVAVALEGTLAGSENARLAYFGSGYFSVTEQGAGQSPDNIHMMANAIDWLSDNTELIALRNTKISTRPIRVLEDSEKNIVKYSNAIIPVLLVIFAGLIRFIIQNRKRKKWRSVELF